jgi:2-iminobutanoate/2-iminopropanoate deaminase
LAALDAAGMAVGNLVKVTTFVRDREDLPANSRIRQEVLGGHVPALTVVLTGLFDERALLEVEAVAAA